MKAGASLFVSSDLVVPVHGDAAQKIVANAANTPPAILKKTAAMKPQEIAVANRPLCRASTRQCRGDPFSLGTAWSNR